MFKRLCTTLVSLVVIGSGLSVATSSAFAAGGTPSCQGADTSTSSGNCADSVIATSKSSTTDKSYAAVNTAGKILVRYNMASGIKLKSSETTSNGCKLYAKASQRPASATCVRLKTGAAYINSGVRIGQTSWTKWNDTVPTWAAWCKFVKRGSQWYKAGCYSYKQHKVIDNCGNAVWFAGPKPSLTAKQVIIVRSFEDWVFSGSVAVQSSATATASAKAWCNTSNSSAFATGNGSGSASGKASASYKVKGLTEIKAWLNGTEASLKQSTSLQVDASARASSVSNAVAAATAQVTCSSTPPQNSAPNLSASAGACVAQGGTTGVINGTVGNPNNFADTIDVTLQNSAGQVVGSQQRIAVAAGGSAPFQIQNLAVGSYTVIAGSETTQLGATVNVTIQQCSAPPQHFVQISCTGFEEISGGGSFLVDCAVSNDNGAQISLSANSNDGNSRVSGINCYSQGGTPACQGNGTFEFRVTGINNGSTVVYSSVTAVASSNGVTATYNSGQFPVDPSGGGF